ncbi:TIGR02300 family protein [Pseudomonadota bacterium]|nr:TIGR02300 family protein [Pseudomonadota bacterium]
MAKLEWGKKRICPSCGLKYYDFNKSPITCPTCNVEFDPDLYLKSRKGKSISSKLGTENKVNTPDVEDIEVETVEETIDEELIIEGKVSDDETETSVEDDRSFVDEDDINGEDVVSVDIIEEEKD